MISDIKKRLEGLLHLLEQMAGGDLKVRLPLTPARDEIDAIAFGVNLLADEVQFKQSLEERRRMDLEAAQAKLEFTLRELERTQDQLVQSAKLAAIGELCAGMAHEINNPLTIIQGYFEQLEMLLKERGSVDAIQGLTAIEKIGRNITRIVELIKAVKGFSRQNQAEFRPINLVTLVESCLALLEQQFLLRRIQVHRRYQKEQQLQILADGLRFEQALLHVLTNAIDAIDAARVDDRGNIEVTLGRSEKAVLIEISDDGVGLDPASSKKVFDPFFTTKPVGRGTGLGLSISHKIIRDHNGTIDLSPARGTGGATVRIEIPATVDAHP